MSVQTTFDALISDAKYQLESAADKLHEALDRNTWGYSDMDEAYIEKLYDLKIELLKIINKL